VSPRLVVILALLTTLLGGCYWSDPPAWPYGHGANDAPAARPLTMPGAPQRLHSPRIIVLGRFDTLVTQPIGGLYDWSDYDVSPLFRTYYFKNAHLELFEHATDALRAAGLDVRKDYATTGDPALVEAPLRAKSPLIVRTRVLTLQHDQVRTDAEPPMDFEVVKLVVDVAVFDVDGAQRYMARHAIHGRMDAQDPANLLRMLGLELGARLLKDAAFLKAIEAAPGGVS
jgi:hypothetical protein